VKDIEMVEMVEMTSKDTMSRGTGSELPLDTKILTQREKGGTSVLSLEEEED